MNKLAMEYEDRCYEHAHKRMKELTAAELRQLGAEEALVKRFESNPDRYVDAAMLELGSRLLSQEEKKNEG
jgi:hypothetical protein